MLPVAPSFTQWCFSPSHQGSFFDLHLPTTSGDLSSFLSVSLTEKGIQPGLGWLLSPSVALQNQCSSASALPQVTQASALHQQRSALLCSHPMGKCKSDLSDERDNSPSHGCALQTSNCCLLTCCTKTHVFHVSRGAGSPYKRPFYSRPFHPHLFPAFLGELGTSELPSSLPAGKGRLLQSCVGSL